MNTLEGKLVATDMKVGIVAGRFNEFITSKLVGGAMDGLLRHDVKDEDVVSHGYLEHLKSHWLHRKWQKAESTMQ